MAKKHKNLDNIPIQWDGDLSHPEAGNQGQSIPDSVDLGTWGGYVPCWYPANHADCVIEDMYFEDFDITGTVLGVPDGIIDANDSTRWSQTYGRFDILLHIINEMYVAGNTPNKAPKITYTWGDVSFVIEIADGLGTGNRRAREARLQQLDKDTKKRLIHLICRVKGEKVYDEEKEVGDIQIKLDDVDMVINKVVGTMKVSTEWEEVDWDYGYDK